MRIMYPEGPDYEWEGDDFEFHCGDAYGGAELWFGASGGMEYGSACGKMDQKSVAAFRDYLTSWLEAKGGESK